MVLRTPATLGELVVTTILFSAGLIHEAVRTRPPASTTQTRHTPAGVSFCWWHNVGMRIPFTRAASKTVVPAGTVTASPSMVRLTSLIPLSLSHRAYAVRAAMVANMHHQLIVEMLDHGGNGGVGKLPQTANGTQLQCLRQFVEQIEIRHCPFSVGPGSQNVDQ